jgi:hypothetical protein
VHAVNQRLRLRLPLPFLSCPPLLDAFKLTAARLAGNSFILPSGLDQRKEREHVRSYGNKDQLRTGAEITAVVVLTMDLDATTLAGPG